MAKKRFNLDVTDARKLVSLLNSKGYKETYDIVDMLSDMGLELEKVTSTMGELVNGLYMFNTDIGSKAYSNWEDMRSELEIATEFGERAIYFFDAHRLSYDNIPDDADEYEVRTDHALHLLNQI